MRDSRRHQLSKMRVAKRSERRDLTRTRRGSYRTGTYCKTKTQGTLIKNCCCTYHGSQMTQMQLMNLLFPIHQNFPRGWTTSRSTSSSTYKMRISQLILTRFLMRLTEWREKFLASLTFMIIHLFHKSLRSLTSFSIGSSNNNFTCSNKKFFKINLKREYLACN